MMSCVIFQVVISSLATWLVVHILFSYIFFSMIELGVFKETNGKK